MHKIKIRNTIISHVVLHGSEIWSLTLREEHKLRMIEKRVLRKIFASKRDKLLESLFEIRNEELHNLYTVFIRMIK
jgi:hypothetical protein